MAKETVKKAVKTTAKKVVKPTTKKVVKSAEELAFDRLLAKNEFSVVARSAGKKKLFEVFKAGVKFGKSK